MDCCLWWQQWRKSWGVQLYAGEKSTSPWSLPRIKDYSQRKTEVISTPNRLQPQNIIILATMWYLLCCPSLHLFLTTMFKLILLLCYRHQKTKYHFCQIGNNWALTAAHCFFNQYTHQQDCFWHFQSFPNWTQCLGFVQGRFDGCAGCPRSKPCCHTGYSTFSKVPIGASTSCFWKKANHLFLSSCAEGKSRYSFLQEGVENLRISVPPRL